jgi:hypothetical protein
MRVILKTILDCDADAAWRALRSPAVFGEVLSPVGAAESLEPGGFPTVWPEGEHRIRILAAGLLPVGGQTIKLNFETQRRDGVRIVRDTGHGDWGMTGLVTTWEHAMAVSPAPGAPGRTLYRDRLKVTAGVATPAAWYGLWVLWQWRQLRLRQLAPGWAYDPEVKAVEAADDQAGDQVEA